MKIFRQYAPTWLVQLPALLPDAEFEMPQRKVLGATRERMLREMAEALEILTVMTCAVVVLEDLQWSDHSTLELSSYVTQRREPARLLVLGTYRPTDVIVSRHPVNAIKQDLHGRRLCQELALGFLSEAAISQYLAVRFPQHQFPEDFQRFLCRSTDGNLLFLVNVVDCLVAQEVMREIDGQWRLTARLEDLALGVPESSRQMIERQIEQLAKEEQRILEAASVAEVEFSGVVAAAGLEETVERVEEQCEDLVRRGQFLRSCGTELFSDGTVTGRYGFLHALYQHTLFQRVPATQRIRFHRRIGEQLERASESRAGETATELAMHFERGHDSPKAVHYLQQAAETALQRAAYQEALDHVRKGLGLLPTLPDTTDRVAYELMLQAALGIALTATKGYAAPEAEKAYTRTRELFLRVGDNPQLLPALFAVWLFHLMRAELGTAGEIADQSLLFAQRYKDPSLMVSAHVAVGITRFNLGQFATAKEHLERGFALYDPAKHRSNIFTYEADLGGVCLNYGAWNLWNLGYPDQALQNSQQSLVLAERLAHGFTLSFALDFTAGLHQFRREASAARTVAEAGFMTAHKHDFPFWLPQGTIYRGWSLVEEGQIKEGISLMQQGVEMLRALAKRTRYVAFPLAVGGRVWESGEV